MRRHSVSTPFSSSGNTTTHRDDAARIGSIRRTSCNANSWTRASSAASAPRIWWPWSACCCTLNCDSHRTRPVGGCKGAELMAEGTLQPRQYMAQSSSARVSCCGGSIFSRHRSMSKVLARAVKARGWTSCVRRLRRDSVFMTDSASCSSVRKSLDVRGRHVIDSERDGRTQA
jgi:hypothetical protein